MQISQITVRRSVKINLGNYENTDFEATVTFNLIEGEHIIDEDLWGRVNGLLRNELDRHGFKTDQCGLE